MKKVIVFILVVALCVPTLASCAFINKVTGGLFDNTLKKVSEMYSMSSPTKVVATTKQTIGAVELNCSYELVTGYVDNKPASVYTVTTEEIRSVEDGGNTDVIKSLISSVTKKTEAIEGIGSRTNGGEWNPQGSIWVIGRGRMALNLNKKYVENMNYENHTLTFTVPQKYAANVLGAEYATDISSDVEITIVDDGAVITSVDLHYFLAGDESANLVESEMTVKVVYTYDLERITIE